MRSPKSQGKERRTFAVLVEDSPHGQPRAPRLGFRFPVEGGILRHTRWAEEESICEGQKGSGKPLWRAE